MKDKKFHVEASKLFTDLSFLLAFGFVVFCCYEMHRLQDLTPIAYLGAGVLVLLGLVVNAYMKRAAAKDLANQKIYETKIMSIISVFAFAPFWICAFTQLSICSNSWLVTGFGCEKSKRKRFGSTLDPA